MQSIFNNDRERVDAPGLSHYDDQTLEILDSYAQI